MNSIYYKRSIKLTKKEKSSENSELFMLAVRTGLEPATPCVTGMYSNQLNYRTNPFCAFKETRLFLICDAKVHNIFILAIVLTKKIS